MSRPHKLTQGSSLLRTHAIIIRINEQLSEQILTDIRDSFINIHKAVQGQTEV